MENPYRSCKLRRAPVLGQPVTPVLAQTLEPPDLAYVDRAFESLHEMSMISRPDDDGVLTETGHLASR